MIRPTRHLTLIVALVVLVSTQLGALQSDQPAAAPTSARAIAEAVVAATGAVCDALDLPGPARTVLASVDYSGRRFCNTVLRIRPGRPPSVLDELNAWNVETLKDVIADVDGDGTPELVLPTDIAPYEGGVNCLPLIPVPYRCGSDKCADGRTSFREYYFTVFEEFTRRVNSTAPSSGDMVCRLMERDKVSRLLNLDRTAGLLQARQWMTDPNPVIRRRAFAVLSDIDDPDARAGLAALAKDRDPSIAHAAAEALKGRESTK